MTRKHPAFAAAVIATLTLAGCHRQPKPQPVVPPPMLSQNDILPLPEVLPPENEPIVAAPPPAPPVIVASKPKPSRPRGGKKITDLKSPAPPPTVETPASPPENSAAAMPKITTPSRDVPTTAAISEGLPHADEMHHKMTAAQLNQSTEDNLRSLNRTLTGSEQCIVAQIRNFIAQSQEAITDNDNVRAHNLALKAHLLSDELAHR